jgi:hypothetical protein
VGGEEPRARGPRPKATSGCVCVCVYNPPPRPRQLHLHHRPPTTDQKLLTQCHKHGAVSGHWWSLVDQLRAPSSELESCACRVSCFVFCV